MKLEKRTYKRVLFKGSVTLTSSHKGEISANLENISLGGVLISEPSCPVDQAEEYKIKITSITEQPIYLSVLFAWQKDQYVGMRITQYHFDSRNQLIALISDLKYTNEIVELLHEGWLDDLFDDQGRKLESI